MRLEEIQNKTQSYGAKSEGSFGISQNDTSHILAILRDKLYSDKVMAVLREYGTNALDAHVDAGTPKLPIDVTLPTQFTPFLVIRDYGLGLSENDIYTIYTQYGRSTKRQSDNAIGQLGLGCKSAFAYTQQFAVTSWHGDRKMVYNAYIDESNVGKMTKMLDVQMNTAEQNGIEIRIPVKLADIATFKERAQRVYYYFEPRPKINTQIEKPDYAITRGWWRIRGEWGIGPMAIMGSIGYPLRKERLTDLHHDLLALLDTPVEIRFGIGELSISANREDLEYTDHARASITKRLTSILKGLRGEIESELKNATTIWGARKKYWEFLHVQQSRPTNSNHASYGTRSRNIFAEITQKYAKWNGFNLQSSRCDVRKGNNGDMEVKILEKGFASFRQNRWHVNINKNLKVAINDHPVAYLQRSLTLRGLSSTLIILCPPKDMKDDTIEAATAAFLAHHGLTGITVTKLSEVEYNPKAALASSHNLVARKKASKKVFLLKDNFNPSASTKSDNWDTVDVSLEDDEGLYLPISRFVPEVDGSDFTMEDLENQISLLKEAGYTADIPQVHGIKIKYLDKLGSKWTSWIDWFNTEYAKVIKTSKLLTVVPSWKSWSKNNHRGTLDTANNSFTAVANVFLDRLGPKHPLNIYLRSLARDDIGFKPIGSHHSRGSKRYKNLYKRFKTNPELKKLMSVRYDYQTEWALIESRYPMIKHTNVFDRWRPQTNLATDLAHYIKIMDRERKNDE